MITKFTCLLILIILLISSIPVMAEEIPVMITIEETLPDSLTGKASGILSEFLKQNGFEVLLFPEEKQNSLALLIKNFMENSDTKLADIAKEKGALFLICGKLQAMETDNIKIYDKTLIQIEVFGEMKLTYLNNNNLPLNIKLKGKGLVVNIEESYLEAIGKALDSVQQSIISGLKIPVE